METDTSSLFQHTLSRRSFVKSLSAGAAALALGGGMSLAGCSNAANTANTASQSAAVTYESFQWPDPSIVGNFPETTSAGQDFFAWVNKDWITSTSMPEGLSRFNAITEIQQRVTADCATLLKNPGDNAFAQQLAPVFQAALNYTARDAYGLGVVQESVQALLAASSLDQLSACFTTDPLLTFPYARENNQVPAAEYTGLLPVQVLPDDKDSSVYLARIKPPVLSLTDSDEYTKRSSTGDAIYQGYSAFARTALGMVGVDASQADALIAALYDFEGKLAAHVRPASDQSAKDYIESIYNPMSADEAAKLCTSFPLAGVLARLNLGAASRFCVEEPDALRGLDALYTQENLEGLKAYLAVGLLLKAAPYATSALENAYLDFVNTVNGATGRDTDENMACERTKNLLNELYGVAYAATYSSQETKDQVQAIATRVQKCLVGRVQNADWLGEETRKIAADKLQSITCRIGYPEVYAYDYATLQLSAGDALLQHFVAVLNWRVPQIGATADTKVVSDVWTMSAAEINACYEPTDNSINFPASFLQEPFYSPQATLSTNYGGIGIVIGHEITHAIDKDGSQYDKTGCRVNWWTDADKKAFEERAQKVEDYFGSIEVVDGQHVDGASTLGENTADLGGLACVVQIVEEDDGSLEEVFRNWAVGWREIITKERCLIHLKTNVHSPNYLRPNATSQQMQQFYDTFGIKEGDFMYLPPEKRIQVW
ncbi:MAG: M13 family metallopeptidase [Coriobacteriia bacterium]|nr:M13 family metallopeptidase [Coriobacteriia bacterium]